MSTRQQDSRLVIFGFGNPGRGDDVLGLALLRRLASEPEVQTARVRCRLIEAIQLQIEHALDLIDHDLALFVDASMAGRAPYAFRRLYARRDVTYTSHVMSPAALLQVYETICRRCSAPPAYQLTIRGEHFELDGPLSEHAVRHLDAAHRFVTHLCAAPKAENWDQHIAQEVA